MIFFYIYLLQAIRRLSENDHEVIKESCVILNRVFTTVEFKDTMKTFGKEPEKLGQHILIKEEEEMKIFEKESKKFGEPFLGKEEEEISEKVPKKFGQLLISEDVIFYIRFMLTIMCSLIFPVALVFFLNLDD